MKNQDFTYRQEKEISLSSKAFRVTGAHLAFYPVAIRSYLPEL
jgi:hypothetical protein